MPAVDGGQPSISVPWESSQSLQPNTGGGIKLLQRKREECRNGLRWLQTLLQWWALVRRSPPSLHHQSLCSSHASLLSTSVGSWPGLGGTSDLAAGSKSWLYLPSIAYNKVRVGSPAFGRAVSGTTFPNSATPCAHQGCFILMFCFSFDLKCTSFPVIPQNKKSFRERLRCCPCHYMHVGERSGALSSRRLVTSVCESLQSDVSIVSVKYLGHETSLLPSRGPLDPLTIHMSSFEGGNWISRTQYITFLYFFYRQSSKQREDTISCSVSSCSMTWLLFKINGFLL